MYQCINNTCEVWCAADDAATAVPHCPAHTPEAGLWCQRYMRGTLSIRSFPCCRRLKCREKPLMLYLSYKIPSTPLLLNHYGHSSLPLLVLAFFVNMLFVLTFPRHICCTASALVQGNEQVCTVVSPGVRQFCCVHFLLKANECNKSLIYAASPHSRLS